MVQIIQEHRKPTALERFGQIISGGLQGGVEGGTALRDAMRSKQERETLAERFGPEFKNIYGPDLQRMMVAEQLRGEEKAASKLAQFQAEKDNYEKIKKSFGEEFADVWLASPVGARTALESAAIQQGLRKLPVSGLFGQETEEEIPQQKIPPKKTNMVQLPSGESFTFPEITKPSGMTPSDEIKYKSSLRKDNRELHKTNIDKSHGLKDIQQHLSILDNLNDRMDEGLARLAIDKEGNIRPSALRFKFVPKEYERFSKTVNDFLTSAKDVFGARVTNYDIAQFKQRLPSLLNSKEGRKEIIKQMKIFNQIEQNYRKALSQIYRHYGLDGIPEEQAEAMAEEMTRSEEERLRAELLSIGLPEEISSEMESRPSLEEIFSG